MAAHINGDNSHFSDDEFDHLPENALEELERHAIQLTQAAAVQAKPDSGLSSNYGNEFDDDDLDDAVVIDEARSTPAQQAPFQHSSSTQLGYQEPFRQQRYAAAVSLANKQHYNGPPPPSQGGVFPTLASRTHPHSTSQPPPPPPLFNQTYRPDVAPPGEPLRNGPAGSNSDNGQEDLQRQLEELFRERNALRQDLNAKAGEIAIVRNKHEKAAKEYEREMNATKKLHAEQTARQQKAIEAARNAERNAATERDFFKQDLAEEAERVRRLNKAKGSGETGVTTTPKKKLSHRDGFDDDELEFVSPSKLSPSKFQKRLAGSPSKAGTKRKRKAPESPIPALEVMQIDEPELQVAAVQMESVPAFDEHMIHVLSRQEDRLDFLAHMIDHRPRHDQARTFDSLSKYALPSAPGESFSSIIFGKIPMMGMKETVLDLPVEFCELLISLWARCITEKLLKPVHLFIDLLISALEFKTISVAPQIIDTLIPLVQITADIVAIPRFNRQPADPFDKDVDVSACLSLIHLAALGCMADFQNINRFWKLMRWDFVLLILSLNHPVVDFEIMLRILSTSVMKDSFGTISSDEQTQNIHIGYIIDRLTWPLCEVPYLPSSLEKLDGISLSKLRFRILELLSSMTRSTYSATTLAQHPTAISRIVSMMSDELDALYDHDANNEDSPKLICLTTHLLYHLIIKYELAGTMQKRLSAINGGFQKYLLCLARLNFSEEDLVFESGIGPDVAHRALEMLELAVTPDEGTAIQLAFLE
ncbi:DNA repair protein rad26 [Phlyctema vagabunda]|uniref:DNA repair protein rad26 n=1 Tax=Phlyctema vagabunda TaxID=108571 RepID=A0ABR4PKT0_9HELO